MSDRAPLDRRAGDRRRNAPTDARSTAVRRDQRVSDRRRRDARVSDRLVGIFVPHMTAHALGQTALAARLGVSEDDLLDLAWQPLPRDRAALAALARRYGADEAVLAAILRTAT